MTAGVTRSHHEAMEPTVSRIEPCDLSTPAAWPLHGIEEASRAHELATWGFADLAWTARYIESRLREQEYAHRAWWVATVPGSPAQPRSVVGCAAATLPLAGNEHLAEIDLLVHPAHRRRGIGTALHAAAMGFAREGGRTTAIVASDHLGEPAENHPRALSAPTGHGRVLADDAGAAFARARGWTLEQAERYSVLDLPVDPTALAALRDEATAAAGGEYRLVRWADRAPDTYVDAVAELYTRMSTEVPLADLAMTEERWDGERVRTDEQGVAEAGDGFLLVAAEHVATGRLAAFTEVEYPRHDDAVVIQQDTLVLPEHRGRRLGMLVKTAMLDWLAQERPEARRVHTWNAEENAHMLAINVALGFRGRGVVGLWQRGLD